MPSHGDIYSGLVRLHVLHHACHESVFGLEMIHELRRHGYKLGPGTIYPLLHSMEERGLLRSHREKKRRVYRATPAGRRALKQATEKVRELYLEITEDED
jgi:PadR family transcriptional regulator PadR